MNLPKTYNRAFIYAIIFTVVVTLTAIFIYSSLSKWQNTLVEKNKLVCELFANKLFESALSSINVLGKKGLMGIKELSSSEIKLIDSTLKKLSVEQLKVQVGLEGGFYLKGPDEFYGYSFPTSPPPVPVYGPPPRSYNIIKTQSLQSIEENRIIVNLHAFDAAIFPLATKPLVYNSEIVGIVWVRIHIQDDLPIIKLKQVVNVAAIISILGFLILMIISALWGGEIKGIKKEMENIRHDPSFRLRKRWGIFGYISSNINEMLETIEKENLQRHKLEQELNQKEKLASLGNMIAGVAHEVKTPLAIIKTRIQMWQQEVSKSPQTGEQISPESMQIVIDETNRLSSLVKRLLIFSRPIDKKMKLTDINKLINEVISFISIERNNKDIAIQCSLDRELPLIPIDVNSIKQVMINILDNSIEAMTHAGTINIVTGRDGLKEKLMIEISDTGKGIPEEILNKIFEPFFTSKETGVGLGLAISYQIIKAHNGEIFFSNNSVEGTKCIIKLPI
jgi:signal transduction histidine kinase